MELAQQVAETCEPKRFCGFQAARMRGFTLLELLTILTVLIILSSISLAVAARVKRSTRATQCVANLRQLGFGLAMYVGENNTYPLARDITSVDTHALDGSGDSTVSQLQTWFTSISRYIDGHNELGCPELARAYIARYGDSLPMFVAKGFYGYNAYGTGWNHPDTDLGLGRWLTTIPPHPVYPIRPSMVRSPSDMIAVGDANVFANGIISPFDGPIGFWPEQWAYTTKDVNPPATHAKSANILFCDGHVKPENARVLVQRGENLRRWNNDFLRHEETW